jgi:hypothetical protein
MSGVGADGIVINYGHVDSQATGSSVVAVIGDRSQAINAGLMTVGADDVSGLFALGEDASALNLGRIVATGGNAVGIEGVLTNTHLTNRGVVQITADASVGIGGFGDGHELTNFGLIAMHGDLSAGMAGRGIIPEGLAGADTEIVNAGRIVTEGNLSVGMAFGLTSRGFGPAEHGTMVNRGVVETEGDGSAGVAMIGDGHHLINSGRITTDGGVFDSATVGPFRAAGVVVVGDDALVENTRSGIIRSNDAASAAVELNVVEREGLPAANTASRLENFGLISAPDIAVLGGAGHESVVNHGRIVGDVALGAGDDTFVFGKGGSVSGDVALGSGNDLVLVEDGSGLSRIADFAAGDASGDMIDVSAFFSNFNQLTAHAHQRGANVVIDLDRNDTLVLENVSLANLKVGDFDFIA